MPRDTTTGRTSSPSGQDLALKLEREMKKGSIARVSAVLAEGASVIGTRELRPIVMAAYRSNLEMVKFMLKHGADVNALQVTRPGIPASERCLPFPESTALHLAAGFGRVDIVRVLLQAGAKPNITDTSGLTPLMAGCASEGSLLAALRSMHNRIGDKAGPEEAANCERLSMETGRELLKGGADPLMTDNYGHLALHTAAFAGNAGLISVLLSAAPHTLNQENDGKETALYLAAKEGRATAVDRLVLAGATHPIDPQDEVCPIAVAVCQGHEEVLGVLIEKGSDTVGGLLRRYPVAVVSAVAEGRARILHQVFTGLLGADRVQLPLGDYVGLAGPVLHYAAGYVVPASVRHLLAVGADESALDALG